MAPTWDVPVLFFLQTTILTLIGPLFRNKSWNHLRCPVRQRGQSKLSAKGPPFHFLLFQGNLQNRTGLKSPPFRIFFRHCATFFRKFFNVPKGFPLWVFCYFATECMFGNQKGSPLLHFSALCDIFRKKKFFRKFQVFFQKNVLRFLSLRYSADFRSPVLFFKFCQNSTLTLHLVISSHHGAVGSAPAWQNRGRGFEPVLMRYIFSRKYPALSGRLVTFSLVFFGNRDRKSKQNKTLKVLPIDNSIVIYRTSVKWNGGINVSKILSLIFSLRLEKWMWIVSRTILRQVPEN